MFFIRSLKLLIVIGALFSPGALGLRSVDADGRGATACGTWKLVAGPSTVSALHSVAALSTNNVWATGSNYGPGGSFREPIPLVEHWDGIAWSIVETPGLDSGGGVLESISADANRDVWAVGNQLAQSGTLIEHWNGSQWSIVPAAPVNGYDATFAGVAALTKSNVWAVGSFYQTPKKPGAAGVGKNSHRALEWQAMERGVESQSRQTFIGRE